MKLRQVIGILSVAALLTVTVGCAKVTDTDTTTTTTDGQTTTAVGTTLASASSSQSKKTTVSPKPSVPSPATTTKATSTSAVASSTTTRTQATVPPFFDASSQEVLSGTVTSTSTAVTTLVLKESYTLFRMELPTNWTQAMKEDNYLVFKKGEKNTGRILYDSLWTISSNGTVLSEATYSGIVVETVTYPAPDGIAHVYRADVSLSDTSSEVDHYFRIEMDAATVSQRAFANMVYTLRKTPREDNFLHLEQRTDTLTIGVYGNSFVGSSSVALTLQEMCSQSNRAVHVVGESRGYYSVAKYMADSTFVAALKGDTYDAVFMCGLYGTDDIQKMVDFQFSATVGNAVPVLFPAPNEAPSNINTAIGYCQMSKIANWRDLDYYLRDEGVDVEYLRIDDAHDHSRPLSGYAAACMMYYMMFHEMPAKSVGADYAISSLQQLGLSTAAAASVAEQVRQKTAYYLGVKLT